MSTTSTAERRRVEMAEKRAKLAALRKAREEREASLASSRASPAQTRPSSTLGGERPGPSGASRHDEIETLLRNVGVSGSTSLLRESASGRHSRATSVAGSEDVPQESDAASREPASTKDFAPLEAAPQSPVVDVSVQAELLGENAEASTRQDATSAVQHVVPPPPKPKELYDKSVQTAISMPVSTKASEAEDPHSHAGGVGSESSEELRSRIIAELEEERRHLDREIAEERRQAELALEAERAKGLPETALQDVLGSSPFLDFLDHSSKIVQRALADSYDYLKDYTISADDVSEGQDSSRVRLLGNWWDEKWARGRSVTAVDWSPKFPELFVAAYNRNPMAVNEPDGVVCVWNLHSPNAPEFVLHAQSDVLCVAFSPFHPNIIIGGTYSGQILLWDTRSRNPNPTLRTPLSAAGHTHPIYALTVAGSQNAHNIVSASTDGTVCAWTVDMLAKPQETLELVHPAHSKADEVSVTTLGFPEGETTNFHVGTEEGNIYAVNRYDRAGAKAGLVQQRVWRGHSGPITGLDFHPASGKRDLSNLFLSSGVDWTVKMWPSSTTSRSSAAAPSTASARSGDVRSGSTNSGPSNAEIIAPLFSFEHADDYVFDVKWHPQHPAVFATVDGAGVFDLWNINVDTEVPAVSTVVAPAAPRGLNKVAWDRAGGRRVAIGSSDGRVYVYEISAELVTPKEDDWDQMRKICNAALQNQAEASVAAR